MYKVGMRIFIYDMMGEPRYNNTEGVITSIDSMGHLHGTWGGLAIIPGEDDFVIMEDKSNEERA